VEPLKFSPPDSCDKITFRCQCYERYGEKISKYKETEKEKPEHLSEVDLQFVCPDKEKDYAYSIIDKAPCYDKQRHLGTDVNKEIPENRPIFRRALPAVSLFAGEPELVSHVPSFIRKYPW
jgi:hypothetical protein